MKKISAVKPYVHPNYLNFKSAPYNAWEKNGGNIAKSHYPLRILHSIVYKIDLPTLCKNTKEARLRFVSGFSISFDTFPDYMTHEIVPLIWDCWPPLVDNVASFFRKHKVKTAIFTSSQTAEIFRAIFPEMSIFHVTEGVDLELYSKGKPLAERGIDILEVGRKNGGFFKTPIPKKYNQIKTGNFNRVFKTDEDFRSAMADSKVTINVPRCDVDKNAGDIETLTQRYWECMLSRVVMIGRAPRELTDLIGYNPVIEWDKYDATPLVCNILEHINDYQSLVDKNYNTALRMASWNIRIRQIMDFLVKNGYQV